MASPPKRVFASVVASLLRTEAARRIGRGRAALCGEVPVTREGLELLLLGESADWADALGSAPVITALVVLPTRRAARAWTRRRA